MIKPSTQEVRNVDPVSYNRKVEWRTGQCSGATEYLGTNWVKREKTPPLDSGAQEGGG